MVVKGGKSSKKISGLSVEQLLNAISQFLNSSGGIANENDCVKFSNCMKQIAGSMQSICTYLNVLNATEDEAVLTKLLSSGGWETLHKWLSEFKELDESPVLVLLLETFQRLPVSMEMLKANSTAKIIKGLRKHTNDEVKVRASETVDKWMQLIKAKTSSTGATFNHSNSSTKNGEHKEKKKKRHKNTSGEKPENKNTASPPPSEEMDVDRDVPSPPPHTIFKECSKSTSEDKSEKSTAKQHNVKERSAGVEAGLIKPKPRGSKPSKTFSTSPKAPAPSATAVSSHKRVNIELPGLADITANTSSKKPKIDPDKEEDFGKAKLIAPLPKPSHIVQDSGGFMAALMQPRTPLVIKKKRNSTKAPSSPTEKTSPPNTPMSPVAAPPSFYKDTLEGPMGVSAPHLPSTDSSDRLSPVESTVSSLSTTDDNKTEAMDTSASKQTKRVTWKPEKELREYHYFELLENERVNVNRLRDQGGFDEMKKREMITDRAALKNMHIDEGKGLKHSNAPPAVTENFPWKRPPLIELPASKLEPGYLSKERGMQTEREIKVLAAIYFSKAAMPSSATEPDNHSDTESSGVDSALNIPLEIGSSGTMADNYQQEPMEHIAPDQSARPALLEAPTECPQSVSDLVPGVTANDMDLIQKLANGEGGQEILEALANTDCLNEIMQTEGISPFDNSMDNGSGPPQSLLGDSPYNPSHNFNRGPRPMMNPADHRGGYNGSFRGRGGQKASFPRGGYRGGGPAGSWNIRGRGRGRGKGECHRFVKTGKCSFGDNCMFLHSTR